jgi:hypothetical protein
LALRIAWFIDFTVAFMPTEIARPAASSAALLIRRPDERRSIDFDRAFWVLLRLR